MATGSVWASSTTPPTYTEDIAPILKANCQSCHKPGEPVPMDMTSYREVRPWARSIKQAVASREMPPWFADPRIGHLADERRLSDEEIATISAWVDAGAPRGPGAGDPLEIDASDLPGEERPWKIGTPDLVLTMNEIVLNEGEDDILRDVLLPLNLDRDLWISEIEIRPGNPDVVHHANLRAIPADREKFMVEYLSVYAPGYQPVRYDPGEAFLLPAGTDLVLGMHYFKDADIEARDQTQVGLNFTRVPVKVRRDVEAASNEQFTIPAGHPNFPVRSATRVMGENVSLEAIMPHMHYRGKDMKVWAQLPGGELKPLLFIPEWDFDWQLVYQLEEPVDLPPGTVIYADCHFDNSKSNPMPIDPTVEVPAGPRSYDEMATAVLFLAVKMDTPYVPERSLFGGSR